MVIYLEQKNTCIILGKAYDSNQGQGARGAKAKWELLLTTKGDQDAKAY